MTGGIGILFNPISGRGRAPAVAAEAAEKLSAAGHTAHLIESKRGYVIGELENAFAGLTALLVIGGDGTLRPLLPTLAETRVPVYMIGMGNESLFARNFSMSADTADFLCRLESGAKSEHCFATAHFDGGKSEPFFSMLSVGLDAAVIERIAASRTSSIGHVGYIAPTIKSVLSYRPPVITLESSGKVLVSAETGYLNIANSPEYGCGLNPVSCADSSCELLHAGFYPHRSVWFQLTWLWPLMLRRRVNSARSRQFEAKEFRVTASESYPVQADGEFVGRTPVRVSLAEKKIIVLG